MGYNGPKGGIGLPGGVNLPDWVITIIDFRNDKISKDYELSNYNFEKVDKEYDEIDKAIHDMMNLYTPYYSSEGMTGPTGPTGGCHNGCPAGIRVDLLEGEDDKRKFKY